MWNAFKYIFLFFSSNLKIKINIKWYYLYVVFRLFSLSFIKIISDCLCECTTYVSNWQITWFLIFPSINIIFLLPIFIFMEENNNNTNYNYGNFLCFIYSKCFSHFPFPSLSMLMLWRWQCLSWDDLVAYCEWGWESKFNAINIF